MLILDGEGASKLIEITVDQASSIGEAHQVANSIALSPLVKTAFAGGDPNWGRIMMAAGKAGVGLNQDLIALKIGAVGHRDLHLVGFGMALEYNEDHAVRIFGEDEFWVLLSLGRGAAKSTVWTCDLTHDYITINSDYRT